MAMKIEVPEITIKSNVTLDPSKTALIIVDMQNDFVNPKGKLYVPNSEKIIKPLKNLLMRSRTAGATIVYTKDTHSEDDVEFQIWPKHAVKGTWGWEIIDELKPIKGEIIIKKLRYDAFFGTPLDHILRLKKISTLIVTGVVANICVLHTASYGALLGYNIIFPMDTTIALNEFDYYATLRQIDFLYKGTIVKSESDIQFLKK